MTQNLRPANRPPSHELLLLDHAQRLARHRAGRRAIHLRLSRLRPEHRREQHLRIAKNVFETLFSGYDGQLFALRNADLVFITRTASREEIQSQIGKFRPLFADDPAARVESGPAAFCAVYDLETNYEEFLRAAESLANGAREPGVPASVYAPPLQPLRPEELAHVDRALAQADISGLIRRQPVCAVLPGAAAPHPIFSELYVSIADLRGLIAPKVDLASSRWLFQHLTETLDRRMLAAAPRLPEWRGGAKVSLNLNVATLLSDAFIAFIEAVGSAERRTLVIEVQMLDVVAATADYMLARDFLHARGHRICIDGVTPQSAGLFDFGRLGADMAKVVWAQEIADPDLPQRRDDIAALVRRLGEARVILCRCGEVTALDCGQALGINLFQGRYVDALVEQAQKNALVCESA
jgi:EAL domain-containing protein (putative c-di-GMP-specific phosphodiesterase class I)